MILVVLSLGVAALYTIAVNEEPPFAMCTIPPSGYEVDLVRSAFSLYGWRDNEDYNFSCSTDNTPYSATIGRVLMSSYNYSLGYSYSYPTYNLQLGILAYSSISASAIKFINIISFTMWLFIPAFALLILLLLSIFEYTPKNKFNTWVESFQLLSWISLSTIFLSEQNHNYRFPSKLTIFSYFLFSLLFLCVFLAGCMVLTFSGIKLINFPEKLENTQYTTFPAYLDYTSTYGGLFVDVGITSSNIQDKLPLLNIQILDAIVMEYDTVTSVARQNCDYAVTSQPFNSFFYAVEILPGVDEELRTVIDLGLTQLVREFDVQSLRTAYFYQDDICSSTLKSNSGVTMYQLIDLFAGFAIFVFSVFVMRQLCKTKQLLKERNRFIESIKEFLKKPESKVTKIAQSQIRQQDKEFGALLQDLEGHIRKNVKTQGKILNLIRDKQIKNR